MSFLLDVVEVAESHMGEALAKAFAEMLKAFGIEKKVSNEEKALHMDTYRGLDLGDHRRQRVAERQDA